MSINDSSALIDSPAAGRLGENRALYFNEEQGKTEKFRPYGLPDQAWLDRARDLLHAKPKPAGYNDAPPKPQGPRSMVIADRSFGPSPEPPSILRRSLASTSSFATETVGAPSSAPARSSSRRSPGGPTSPTTTRTSRPPRRTNGNGNGHGDDAGNAFDPAGDAASG